MNATASALKRIQQHIETLNCPDQKLALRAEGYLMRYYGSRSLEPLMTACDHPNYIVRFRAAWALAHTHDPRAYETLLHLTRDPAPEVRYDATLGLGILGDERAIEPLIELMSTPDLEHYVDSAAAMGLERLGEPAVPALTPLLQSATPSVRVTVAYTLGGIGDTSAIEPLSRLLLEEEDDLRIAGIESLADIGTAECLALIQPSLNDVSERVRERTPPTGVKTSQQSVSKCRQNSTIVI